jgi:hypothetical protein
MLMISKEQMMTRTARCELAQAAQTFLDKVEALGKMQDLTDLNIAIYDDTDLCIEDAQNVLHFLIQQLERTTNA